MLHDLFVILIVCLVIELHVNKSILMKMTWGCDCENYCERRLLILLEFFLYWGEARLWRLHVHDQQVFKGVECLFFLISLSGIKVGGNP